jgi:hypothetical protein
MPFLGTVWARRPGKRVNGSLKICPKFLAVQRPAVHANWSRSLHSKQYMTRKLQLLWVTTEYWYLF